MALADSVDSLLQRFGVTVTVTKRTVSAYSPVADIAAQTVTESSARCIVISKTTARRGEQEQRRGEQEQNSLQTVNLFFGPSPVIEKGDRFTLSGKVHAIEQVQEFARAGVLVGYKVQATR